MLGTGEVPMAAATQRRSGTKLVAAEFLSRKLWIEFAGTEPSSG